jgi:hypothetical protein
MQEHSLCFTITTFDVQGPKGLTRENEKGAVEHCAFGQKNKQCHSSSQREESYVEENLQSYPLAVRLPVCNDDCRKCHEMLQTLSHNGSQQKERNSSLPHWSLLQCYGHNRGLPRHTGNVTVES